VTRNGLIQTGKYYALAKFWYDKLKFIAHGVRDDITSLSGGNQQKALLARCLAAESDLVLLNDPTSGVDVETKQEIYRLLDEAKQQGKAILLHSTEDLEMEQCDRVYVMHEGSIAEELVGGQVSVQNIIKTSFREKSKGTSAEDKSTVAARNRPGGLLRKVINNRAFLAFATLIGIFIINSFFNRRITSYMGIQLLYSSAVPLVFIALGQMFIVISGGIDLGNGQSVGLLNVLIAFILVSNPGLGVVYIVLVVLAYAGLAAVIYYTRIPAIVITLGASFVWLGLALTVAPVPGGHAPKWLSAFYNHELPVVPMPIVVAIAAALIAYWIVRRSKYGMIINAMGNNPTAVSRAGWSQLTAMMVTYALAGMMTAIGALMLTAISSSGDANSSRAYNMLSIATIILGGCSFFGGISSPVGVVVAALGISSISFLLTFVGIDSNLQSAVTGLILIAALALKLVSGGGRGRGLKT
jgi:ribose transport system ATP-binding protein